MLSPWILETVSEDTNFLEIPPSQAVHESTMKMKISLLKSEPQYGNDSILDGRT